jgi:protein TonB
MSEAFMDNHLPWDDDKKNIKNYRLILGVLLLATIIFSWIVASSILKEKTPRTRAEIPERFVKLVLEQKRKVVIPPPPPPKVVEVEKKEELVKKKPEIKEEIKKKPKQKEIVKVKPKGNRDDAIEKAKQNLAVFDVFADLKDADTSKKIANSSNSSADVGQAKTVTRDMIVNNAVKSSGGVRIAKASTNMGGAGLEGGGSRQVSSNLSAAKIKQSRSGNGGGLADRPSENIEKFMDRNKNSFFSLYNRALRKSPSMQGEVIFKIVILANGSVSEVSIVSSDLNNPTLERKLLTKIRSIRFTAMNVIVWKDNYRINFIPS